MINIKSLLNLMIETGVSSRSLSERMNELAKGGAIAGGIGTLTAGFADGVGIDEELHPARRLIQFVLTTEGTPEIALQTTNPEAESELSYRAFEDFTSSRTYLQRLSEQMFGDGLSETGGLLLLRQLGASLLAASSAEPYSTPSPREATETLRNENNMESDLRAMLLVRTMLSAAKAKGELKPGERHRIIEKLKSAGLTEEEQRFAELELDKPLDVKSLVADIGDRMTAAEVYSASLLALELDSPAERAYLADLGSRLGISMPPV